MNKITFITEEIESFLHEVYLYKLVIDNEYRIVFTIDNSKHNHGRQISLTNDLTNMSIEGLEKCAAIKCNVQREKMVKELMLEHVNSYMDELQQVSTALKDLINRPTSKTKEQLENERAAMLWNVLVNKNNPMED